MFQDRRESRIARNHRVRLFGEAERSDNMFLVDESLDLRKCDVAGPFFAAAHFFRAAHLFCQLAAAPLAEIRQPAQRSGDHQQDRQQCGDGDGHAISPGEFAQLVQRRRRPGFDRLVPQEPP